MSEQTDDTSKVWDRTRPFQRLNSPSWKPDEFPLDGDGHRQGTRRPEDFVVRSLLDAIARRKLIRLTPSWTPTRGESEAEIAATSENEAYGRLRRSFQTWTDVPPDQWHQWYDWNFHVEPSRGFQWLRGAGNVEVDKPAKQENPTQIPIIGLPYDKINGTVLGPANNVVPGHTMECEWDTGAMGGQRPGGMFTSDWCIPMTGEWVWISGRSIYDGGHEQNELTRSELHPCKAIAAARWEAFRFAENGHYVPAIKFMFFASRRGGYFSFPSLAPLNGKDYEFIVDLPEKPDAELDLDVAVGHTPEFPHNTVVLRKIDEPLVHCSFDQFSNAAGNGLPQDARKRFEPKVELLPSSGDEKRRQVKVTIPLVAIAEEFADSVDYYGVVLSMGWPDPRGTEGRKVKKCTFNFVSLKKGTLDHDTFAEEWRFNAGVNGRWFQWKFASMHDNDERSLKFHAPLEIWLGEEDAIVVSAHGAELDLVDDVFNSDRVVVINQAEIEWEGRPAIPIPPDPLSLDIGGTPVEIVQGRLPSRRVDWRRDVDPRPPARPPDGSPASYPVQRAVVRRLFSMMWTTFNDQNAPLGLIDPTYGSPQEEQINPLKVKKRQDNEMQKYRLLGLETWEVGDTAELRERPRDGAIDPKWIDYILTYEVKVEPQFT